MIEAGLNVRCTFLLYIDILSRAFELDLLYVWTSVECPVRYRRGLVSIFRGTRCLRFSLWMSCETLKLP